MTCAVSTQAATKVPKLKATLTSRALSRWPTSASTTPPASGQAEQEGQGVELESTQSSFSFSRWRMSRLSNCSRIWNMNTPRISTPTSTSSAMPSSTTIGMP